jgi:DNA-binding response OmpR family regulator
MTSWLSNGLGAITALKMNSATENYMKKAKSYDLGANAYIVKPMNYEDLFRTVRIINDFWELVEVPENSP